MKLPGTHAPKFGTSISETTEDILAEIDAGIRAADENKFATGEQVQAEFARWRKAKGTPNNVCHSERSEESP